jgi:1-acyl-sn-glycerol-3-phosphate acyltransferase
MPEAEGNNWRRKNWVYRLTRTAAKIFFSPLFRLETKGIENLPRNNAFILLPKHQRWEDIPLIGLATPRPLYYVAKYELFTNPISNWFLRSLGGIPLNRSRPMESRRSLKVVIESVTQGEGVVIFPEGTYHKNKMGPGHIGMVRLVLSRFSPPFIPVGINYSSEGMTTLVRINFGKMFHADTAGPASEFLDQMMKEIARLSGLRRNVHAGT